MKQLYEEALASSRRNLTPRPLVTPPIQPTPLWGYFPRFPRAPSMFPTLQSNNPTTSSQQHSAFTTPPPPPSPGDLQQHSGASSSGRGQTTLQLPFTLQAVFSQAPGGGTRDYTSPWGAAIIPRYQPVHQQESFTLPAQVASVPTIGTSAHSGTTPVSTGGESSVDGESLFRNSQAQAHRVDTSHSPSSTHQPNSA